MAIQILCVFASKIKILAFLVIEHLETWLSCVTAVGFHRAGQQQQTQCPASWTTGGLAPRAEPAPLTCRPGGAAPEGLQRHRPRVSMVPESPIMRVTNGFWIVSAQRLSAVRGRFPYVKSRFKPHKDYEGVSNILARSNHTRKTMFSEK